MRTKPRSPPVLCCQHVKGPGLPWYQGRDTWVRCGRAPSLAAGRAPCGRARRPSVVLAPPRPADRRNRRPTAARGPYSRYLLTSLSRAPTTSTSEGPCPRSLYPRPALAVPRTPDLTDHLLSTYRPITDHTPHTAQHTPLRVKAPLPTPEWWVGGGQLRGAANSASVCIGTNA